MIQLHSLPSTFNDPVNQSKIILIHFITDQVVILSEGGGTLVTSTMILEGGFFPSFFPHGIMPLCPIKDSCDLQGLLTITIRICVTH
jgi:hypothetical protein